MCEMCVVGLLNDEVLMWDEIENIVNCDVVRSVMML